MISRCNYPGAISFPLYGGRGIKVCSRWARFENFLADMGGRPHGASLDRKDPDGDYCPSNCRWATVVEQRNNQRKTLRLSLNGESLSIADWARRSGIARGTIWARLRRGWSAEQILTTPSDTRRVKRFH
jgi:hypothetical protein